MKKILVSLFLTVFCAAGLSAQRTVARQFFMDVRTPVVAATGGSLTFGQYGVLGYWYASAGVNYYYNDKYMDYLAEGGYLWRVVATRDRSLNLYLGIGGNIGYCTRSLVSEWGWQGGIWTEFVYDYRGLVLTACPQMELEFFPWNKVAFFANGRPSVMFNFVSGDKGSMKTSFAPQAFLGIRILFK